MQSKGELMHLKEDNKVVLLPSFAEIRKELAGRGVSSAVIYEAEHLPLPRGEVIRSDYGLVDCLDSMARFRYAHHHATGPGRTAG